MVRRDSQRPPGSGKHWMQPIIQVHTPSSSFPSLTFLCVKEAGLAQLAEEGAPTAGGLQMVQVEVGRVQPTGQVGEAC